MEDSVGEEERREQEETAEPQGKERGGGEGEEGTGGGGGGEGGGNVGFLSSVASKIGAAMSGVNGSGGGEDDAEGNGDIDVVAASSGGEEQGKRNGNGGGIFGKLLSGAPDSLPASVQTEDELGEEGDKRDGQDGILNAVASRIGIAMSGANGHGNRGNEDDANISNGDAADNSKAADKGDEQNGGGIVKQLMSNLPTDDQAPDSQEASLLIAIIDD